MNIYVIKKILSRSIAVLQIEETDLLKNSTYRFYYRTLLITCLKTFAPFLIIAILTIATINGFRKSLNERTILLAKHQQEFFRELDVDRAKSLQA